MLEAAEKHCKVSVTLTFGDALDDWMLSIPDDPLDKWMLSISRLADAYQRPDLPTVTELTTPSDIRTVNFTQYKLLYVPSASTPPSSVKGGITDEQNTELVKRKADIRAFVSGLLPSSTCVL